MGFLAGKRAVIIDLANSIIMRRKNTMSQTDPLIEGQYYYIYNRGNNGENIFLEAMSISSSCTSAIFIR
ncbi:MAG: hypothetical protein PHP00_11700 [Thiotrichaceae bacterium]|nr:hypothetical protein [Thiotrichaceae bacterium]